ncbi:MAG: N-formylglutamate amidohydrolase [Rhodospirillales bacterium CG15_BIG_FIL_POST_REV_8_21_14_020_66_15]|nr:MAG: N-formylglutamate amidohydrolase [Rhodospirillales bacterium CG15_BIG_FIL_POST_REV_8_21_14_020_66_15]
MDTGRNGDGSAATPSSAEAARANAVDVFRPQVQTAPVVFASPHSGRDYSSDFVRQSCLDATALRRSEDAFVDRLFRRAPEFGAPLIRANFPRAYVDANREAYELDPRMFAAPLPGHVVTRSPRIAAGLGTIARVVANGEEIYAHPLTFAEARKRIEATHRPYHTALQGLIDETRQAFGGCLLIDCHSMPSNIAGTRGDHPLGDVILGDCHGTSAGPAMTALAEHLLKDQGFSVTRNRPYAGGYTTRHYGRPRAGVHVLQIELNRALYLDEAAIEPLPGMAEVAARLDGFMTLLCAGARRLVLPQAAE